MKWTTDVPKTITEINTALQLNLLVKCKSIYTNYLAVQPIRIRHTDDKSSRAVMVESWYNTLHTFYLHLKIN